MKTNKRKPLFGIHVPDKTDFKRARFAKLRNCINHSFYSPQLLSFLLAVILLMVLVVGGFAKNRTTILKLNRVIENDKTGIQNPIGLAYSSKEEEFLISDSFVSILPVSTKLEISKLNLITQDRCRPDTCSGLGLK